MADGPVTKATRIVQRRQPPALAFTLRAWPAVPPLFLLRVPTVDLPARAGAVLGLDATIALVACLMVTPVINAAPWNLGPLRRWWGVWVFALGAAGLLIELAAGPGSVAARAAGNSVNWTGTLIIAVLLPLTATSAAWAQRLLGPEWKRWQRALTWAAWWLITAHLAALHAWIALAPLLTATAPLSILRVARVRRKVREWRRSGYTSGRMWLAVDACALMLIAGLAWLLVLEAVACARCIS